ncbi:MAG: TonB-dependent receptor [Cycloclasticus sp. symbiont of Poecilosclerida sp. M]|nr:MAG: TonB-dependent receptor [Cycloclasticus sp. symbiont of Poecilosclerida sp. M]
MKQRTLTLLFISMLATTAQAGENNYGTIVVEGSSMRPGEFGIAPNSSALKDTASLLKRIPGANVNRNGPLTGIASYRGQYGAKINTEVDGMSWKEVGPNSMDPPLSHIPAALTETLTVYRGIAPVSSGMETIGGSMVVESRESKFTDSDDFEFHGLASLGYSDVDDGLTSALYGSYANKKHRFHASGSLEQGNDFEFDGGKSVDPSQYGRDTYTVGYGYRTGDHEFGFNYSNNDTGHTGTPSLPMDIIYVRGGILSADYNVKLGEGRSFEAAYYYQDMRHWMDNFTLRPNGIMMGMEREIQTEVDGGGLSLVYHTPLAAGNLSLGLEGDQSTHDTFVSDPTSAFFVDNFNGVERDRYSVFTEWEGSIGNGLDLEAGIRYTRINMDAGDVDIIAMAPPPALALRTAFNAEDRSVSDDNWDVSIVATQELSKGLSVEVGLARKTRSPTYQERYLWLPLEATSGLADGRLYIGDIDLDPEVAYQLELGLEYAVGNLYIAPRAFYHRVDDYIQGEASINGAANMVSNASSGRDALQFTNVDAGLYGVDVEWGYELDMNWRLDGTVSYVRGRRRDGGGDNLYRIAPLNTRAQLTYAIDNWSVATEVEAYSAQNDVAAYNGELKTAGYGLLHVRGEIEPVQGLSVGFGVENILDRNHENHTAGINRALGSDVDVGDKVKSPGRNIYITATYDW